MDNNQNPYGDNFNPYASSADNGAQQQQGSYSQFESNAQNSANPKPQKGAGQKAALVISIILGIFFAAFLLFMSISKLTEKEDIYEGNIVEATQFGVMTKKVNFIPAGKMYYYFAADDEGKILLIKAPKSWLEKNYISLSTPLAVKGTIEKLDSKVRTELLKVQGNNQLYYGNAKVIDLEYKTVAIQSILMVVAIIVLVILGIIFSKKQVFKKAKVAGGIFAVVVFAVAIYSIHIITIMI